MTNTPEFFIVSYGRPDLIRVCIESIREYAPASPVRVFDNKSEASQEIRAVLEGLGVEAIFSDKNLGFAAAVNRLAARTCGDFILLNPDARLTGAPASMIEAAQASRNLACVAPGNASTRRYWDSAHRASTAIRSTVSYAGYAEQLRGTFLSELYGKPPRSGVGYLGGAFLFISREAWVAVGEFDERFFLYCEELDWQTRARQLGWEIEFFDEILFEHTDRGTVADSATDTKKSLALLRSSQMQYADKHFGRVGVQSFKVAVWLLDRVQRSKRRHK
ncbi:glycosyltransferase [Rhodococcoides kroppenstedtii]|uniref:glycosyltransferase n=1 Tax=Rhodococcoides kroppenstedtii TaxID=293050 RepID=UPI0036440DBE